jgi:hypothetical protein
MDGMDMGTAFYMAGNFVLSTQTTFVSSAQMLTTNAGKETSL